MIRMVLDTILKVKLRLKGLCIFAGLFVSLSFGVAQDRLELGGYVGTSYYMGDLNPQQQFYQPSLAVGGLGRYVLTDRFAIKGTVGIAGIKGSYPNSKMRFPQGDAPYSFNRKMADATLQMEFNFASYDHAFVSSTNFTPYLTLGLGTTVYKRFPTEVGKNSEQTVFILSLPFGIGAKYKINKWIRVGAEWSFRKTFVDDLDVVGFNLPINPEDPYGFNNEGNIHNNDLYSVVSVHVTFSLLRRKTECKSGF